MVKKWLIPLVSLVVLALNFAWLPFINKNDLISPFIMRDAEGKVIEITVTRYIDYACRPLPYMIILILLIKFMPKYRLQFKILLLIWCGWFVDYFITFNEVLTHYHWMPLSYSFAMAVFLLAWFWYDLLTD